MVRTTVTFHETTLARVRELARARHRSLGETVGELVEEGLRKQAGKRAPPARRLPLGRHHMGTPKIALEDKEAIRALIEKGHT